jgi:hypothetical protein
VVQPACVQSPSGQLLTAYCYVQPHVMNVLYECLNVMYSCVLVNREFVAQPACAQSPSGQLVPS